MSILEYDKVELMTYHCKVKSGLQKNQCKVKTVLPTKTVRFFQDKTFCYIFLSCGPPVPVMETHL